MLACLISSLLMLAPAQPVADMYLDAVVYRYVDITTGVDTNDGLSQATPFKTVERALKDPNASPGWIATVVVKIIGGAASDASSRNWVLSTEPGPKSSGTFGSIFIIGDDSTPLTTAVTTGSGTLLTGKAAQVKYTMSPGWVGTVTDGSHWLAIPSVTTNIPSVRPILASTSPDLIVVDSLGGLAYANVAVNPYNTTFSGSVRVHSVYVANGTTPITVIGIKMTGSVTVSNSSIGCHVGGSTFTMFDGTLSGSYVVPSLTYTAALFNRRFIFNNVLPQVYLRGTIATMTGNVMRGGSFARLLAGFRGTVLDQIDVPGGVGLFYANDFEGTGDGIWLANGSFLGNGISGSKNTFAITGSAFNLTGGRLTFGNGSHTWTGTAGLPSLLKNGSVVWPNGMFQVANTVNAGQDVKLTCDAVGLPYASAGRACAADLSGYL